MTRLYAEYVTRKFPYPGLAVRKARRRHSQKQTNLTVRRTQGDEWRLNGAGALRAEGS